MIRSPQHPVQSAPDNPYRALAHEHGVTLPRLGPMPRRWLTPWQTLRGPAWELPATPRGFLTGLLTRRWLAIGLGICTTSLGTICSALVPWAMGHALDAGLTSGLGSDLALWIGIFAAIIVGVAVGDSLGQITEITTWMGSSVGSARSVGMRGGLRARAFQRESTTGDVVTAVTSDAVGLGRATALIPDLFASTVSTALVAVLMLRTSLILGLIVLIGMPLLVAGLALVARPLQRQQNLVREEQGKLTTISTDAVKGLRILRGIGGEDGYSAAYKNQSARVRAAGISVAPTAAILRAVRSAAPMLFSVAVIAQGAILIAEGEMSVGQLLAFYGYTTFLRHPIWIIGDSVENLTRAWVGAKRDAKLMGIDDIVDDKPKACEPLNWAEAGLVDPVSSLELAPGLTTALLAPSPQVAHAIAHRLARVDDSQQSAQVTTAQGSRLNLQDLPIDQVREAILLSEETPQLFAGSLRENLLASRARPAADLDVADLVNRDALMTALGEDGVVTPSSDGDLEEDHALEEALNVAVGADILSSLPSGLDGVLTESGRNLSGGQRQRVSLARAITQDPAILILMEPTSALDSHTEAMIASKLAQARRGKTTLLITESPLLLNQVDMVIAVDSHGQVVMRGSLEELKLRATGNSDIAGLVPLVRRGGDNA